MRFQAVLLERVVRFGEPTVLRLVHLGSFESSRLEFTRRHLFVALNHFGVLIDLSWQQDPSECKFFCSLRVRVAGC